MIDLKYILIIIFCVACVLDLWRHNRSGQNHRWRQENVWYLYRSN